MNWPYPNKRSIHLSIALPASSSLNKKRVDLLCSPPAFASLKMDLRDSEDPNLVLGLGNMRWYLNNASHSQFLAIIGLTWDTFAFSGPTI